MKIRDVPNEAFTAVPTPVPTKISYDWDKLFSIMVEKGYVVIESEDIRTLPSGAEESVLVKAFNSHCTLVQKQNLRTKRISIHRWYCTL